MRAVRTHFLLSLGLLLLAACTAPHLSSTPHPPSSQPPFLQQQDDSPAEFADEPPAAMAETGALIVLPERVLPGGMLELGSPNAPVTVLHFTNASCEYCQRFHREIEPRLLADFAH